MVTSTRWRALARGSAPRAHPIAAVAAATAMKSRRIARFSHAAPRVPPPAEKPCHEHPAEFSLRKSSQDGGGTMRMNIAGVAARATLGALAVVPLAEVLGEDVTASLRTPAPNRTLAESLVSRREAALHRPFD